DRNPRRHPADQRGGRRPAGGSSFDHRAASHLARRSRRRPRFAERTHAASRGGVQRRRGAVASTPRERRRPPAALGRRANGARDRQPERTRRGREAPARTSGTPLILDEEAVRSLLRMDELIPAMAAALADLSPGKVVQPMRVIMPDGWEGGVLDLLSAYGAC